MGKLQLILKRITIIEKKLVVKRLFMKNLFFKKAQMSMEFVIIFSVIMFLFIFLGMFFFSKYSHVNDVANVFSADDLCIKIANTINQIYFSSDGTQFVLFLPETLRNNKNYSVLYTAKNVVVLYGTGETSCMLVAKNITGNISTNNYNYVKKTLSGVTIG